MKLNISLAILGTAFIVSSAVTILPPLTLFSQPSHYAPAVESPISSKDKHLDHNPITQKLQLIATPRQVK